MADYETEYAVKSAGLVATAEAIRAKTGGTGKIAWSSEKGFAEAVEGISGELTDIDTADGMEVVLTEDNIGKLYRFTGTTDDIYTNGDFYLVERGA